MESIEVNATIIIPEAKLEPISWEVTVGSTTCVIHRQIRDGVLSYYDQWSPEPTEYETLADAVDAVIPRLRAIHVKNRMMDLTRDVSNQQLEAR